MSDTKKLATRIGRAAALGAATVALTAGIASPASAAPAQSGATVVAHGTGTGAHKLYITGVFPMSEHDAHGFINNIGGGGIRHTVLGDDDGSNDTTLWTAFFQGASKPAEKPGGALWASSDGIHFAREVTLPNSVLNEDRSVFDNTDEVYVTATFVDGDGGQRNAHSNVVVKKF